MNKIETRIESKQLIAALYLTSLYLNGTKRAEVLQHRNTKDYNESFKTSKEAQIAFDVFIETNVAKGDWMVLS